MRVNELKRLLKSHGCHEWATNVRGHDVWYSPLTDAKFRVPRHQTQEIPPGTLRSILKQAGL
ncbi:MAG: type II toxin-antitoxin system HicA family toxin [Bacteroidales bacterium]|nr:type II toxin-antitoxin system HicA family toxin [Bacteroidales bacterium]